jgi:hypothetical protein
VNKAAMKRRPSKSTKPRKSSDPANDPRLSDLRLKVAERYGPAVQRVSPRAGIRKLSETITSFISPLELPDETIYDFRCKVALACLVWNISLQPLNEHRNEIRALLKTVPRSEKKLVAELIDQLLTRKLTCFADDKRMIAEFDASETEDGSFFLAVATLTTIEGDLLGPDDD